MRSIQAIGALAGMTGRIRRPAAACAAVAAVSAAALVAGPWAAPAEARTRDTAATMDQAVVWHSMWSGTLDQTTTLTGTWRQEPSGYALTWAAAPTVAVDQQDGMEFVVWRGADGALQLAMDRNRRWTKKQLPIQVAAGGSAPSIASDSKGVLTVVWRTVSDQLEEATNASGTWTKTALAAALNNPDAAPAVAASPATGSLTITWLDSADDVWVDTAAAGSSAWTTRELPATSDPSVDAPTSAPSVAVTSGGTTFVAWRDAGDYMYLDSNGGSGWTGGQTTVEVKQLAASPQVVALGGQPMFGWTAPTGIVREATETSGTWTVGAIGLTLPAGTPIGFVNWPAAAPTLGSRIAAVAESQMGYADPANQGFCNKYSYYFGVGSPCHASGTRSEEWCADFAKWVWAKAGAEADGNLTPSAASFRLWAIANHRWHRANSGYLPQPGDAVVYGLSDGGNWAAHVAIVVGSTNGLPDVVNGDFNYGVSSIVPMEVNEMVIPQNDIGGYATPMPAGSSAAPLRNTANLRMGIPAGTFGAGG